MLSVVHFKSVLNVNKNVIVNVVSLLNTRKMVHLLHVLVRFVQHQLPNVSLIHKVLSLLVRVVIVFFMIEKAKHVCALLH